jgi:L-lactate dehydrogenase
METTHTSSRKVGIVGTGMVGASFAYALMQRSLATEIVLVDLDHERAAGEAMDLNHGLPFVRPLTIRAGGYRDLAGADLVVMTAGANQHPGQTRLDLLQRNAGICREVVPQIFAHNPDGLLVIASNPVDILTHIANEVVHVPWGRIVGSGTILDTARFRYLIGSYFEVDARSVHAYIIGEHGDSAVPVWSVANIGGVRVQDFHAPDGRTFDQAAMDGIFEQTRTAAYEIIKRKQATYYAIGLGLLTLVEAILRNQRTVLTVSTPVRGNYGVTGIALSLPTIVGRQGALEVLDLPLNAAEQAGFAASAHTLRDKLAQVAP